MKQTVASVATRNLTSSNIKFLSIRPNITRVVAIDRTHAAAFLMEDAPSLGQGVLGLPRLRGQPKPGLFYSVHVHKSTSYKSIPPLSLDSIKVKYVREACGKSVERTLGICAAVKIAHDAIYTGKSFLMKRSSVETIGRTGDDCGCARFGDADIVSEGGRLPFFVGEPSSFDETEGVANTSEGSTTSVVGFDGSSTGFDVTTTDREDVEGLRELELLFGLGGIMEDLGGSFNDSFNESLLFPCNGTRCNETSYIVFGESLYPSGYTLPHIILASVLATLLMIVIVVGNMLVIIAIATEKALKNIQNWFIASLAVADFFLGLVIMPFSLANEIMGYWIFGYWWCDIYSAMDVLLCTASIMNLCLISLDRFWSITQAVDYLKKRTPARAALMIALVWLLSALVCIPPLLGWKRPTPAEEYPKCKMTTFRRFEGQLCFFKWYTIFFISEYGRILNSDLKVIGDAQIATTLYNEIAPEPPIYLLVDTSNSDEYTNENCIRPFKLRGWQEREFRNDVEPPYRYSVNKFKV
ncbi:Alpha-2C adrenergic receptor [Melipona quadrifasciata]|uniref:Alpha-2C adrenergic receptor n=1 Tax=Melipona quadrifasciata TaxID=166423 RepID=A0A0N0BKB6_9HYME|nr:Alpha-2C adrenergic receptor [Melipona quadrifasciata]